MNTDFRALTAYEIDYVAGGQCPTSSSSCGNTVHVVNANIGQASNFSNTSQHASAGDGALISLVNVAANVNVGPVAQVTIPIGSPMTATVTGS